jgi:hypothetical protein
LVNVIPVFGSFVAAVAATTVAPTNATAVTATATRAGRDMRISGETVQCTIA